MAAATKWQNDLVLDAALDYLGTCTIMVVITDGTTSYSSATTTYDLATHVLAGGDFSKSDGAVNGRRTTIAEQAAITVDHSGTATGVFIGISSGSVAVFITTCTSQALVAANTVTVPSWTITFADVTA